MSGKYNPDKFGFEVDEDLLRENFSLRPPLSFYIKQAIKAGIKKPKIIIDSNFQPIIVEYDYRILLK